MRHGSHPIAALSRTGNAALNEVSKELKFSRLRDLPDDEQIRLLEARLDENAAKKASAA